MEKMKVVGKRGYVYTKAGKQSYGVELYCTFSDSETDGLRTEQLNLTDSNSQYVEASQVTVGMTINAIKCGFGKNSYYQFVQVCPDNGKEK